MQFAYQFPERIERLALVNAGGLGSDVSPFLRAATLPGRGAGAAAARRLVGAQARTRRSTSVIGAYLPAGPHESLVGFGSLGDPATR